MEQQIRPFFWPTFLPPFKIWMHMILYLRDAPNGWVLDQIIYALIIESCRSIRLQPSELLLLLLHAMQVTLPCTCGMCLTAGCSSPACDSGLKRWRIHPNPGHAIFQVAGRHDAHARVC